MSAAKIDQTVVGPEEDRANCWQAALASITGLPLTEVIDITDPALEPAWWEHTEVWARSRGFELMEPSFLVPKTGLSLVVGYRTRSHHTHAVIYQDGALWHDPHPSRAGLTSVKYALTVRALPTINPLAASGAGVRGVGR